MTQVTKQNFRAAIAYCYGLRMWITCKLCGLMRIKFYDPCTSVDGDTTNDAGMGTAFTAYIQSSWPPMKLPPPSSSAWSARKSSGQSTNQITWSASTVMTVTRNWSSLPVGQPTVLKLLSRRSWGLSPHRGDTIHGLAWKLAWWRGLH